MLDTWELSLLDAIQTHCRSAWGDVVMPAVSSLGNNGLIWLGLTAILLLHPKTRKIGRSMAVALVLDVICCNFILKPLIGRVRPCDLNSAVTLLVPHPTDASFPSGHTAASFAAVAALRSSGSRLWVPALVLAVAIGFSRLYLYVHFPSDVLGGAFLGIVLGTLGAWLNQKFWPALDQRLHRQARAN